MASKSQEQQQPAEQQSVEQKPKQHQRIQEQQASEQQPVHMQPVAQRVPARMPERPWLVQFYGEERARDRKGRSLEDYKKFDHKELERRHDFIQVLFPLPETSMFNWDAPIIDQPTRQDFIEREDLRKSLFEAFKLMAEFYGFKKVYFDKEGKPVIDMDHFVKARALDSWLTSRDHNHLRITRIIRSLRVLGLEPVAEAFYQALLARSSIENGGIMSRSVSVSKTTLMFWKRAAKRPLHLPPDEDDEDARGIVWLRESE